MINHRVEWKKLFKDSPCVCSHAVLNSKANQATWGSFADYVKINIPSFQTLQYSNGFIFLKTTQILDHPPKAIRNKWTFPQSLIATASTIASFSLVFQGAKFFELLGGRRVLIKMQNHEMSSICSFERFPLLKCMNIISGMIKDVKLRKFSPNSFLH